jgi:hypothetical protein
MASLVSDTAKKLVTASDKATIVKTRDEFWKNILGQFDQVQLTEVFMAPSNAAAMQAGRGGRGGFGGFGGGRGNAPASADGLQRQAVAYAKLFAILEKHKKTVDRVTFWGLNDIRTWRPGQHPLILDAKNNRKPAYQAIVDVLLHPESVNK